MPRKYFNVPTKSLYEIDHGEMFVDTILMHHSYERLSSIYTTNRIIPFSYACRSLNSYSYYFIPKFSVVGLKFSMAYSVDSSLTHLRTYNYKGDKLSHSSVEQLSRLLYVNFFLVKKDILNVELQLI